MAKQIKGTDIIEPKHLQEAVEQARLLKQAYLDLDKQVKTTSSSLKSVATGTAGKNTGEIAAITEAYKKSNSVKNSAVQISQQLRAAEDEEVKARLRLQQATSTQKKILTEEIALENKEIGTLQKLAIESNKLRRERERLNLETATGVKRLKEINAQLDKNNLVIQRSSDTLKKQKLNVGNYQGAVNKLTGALGQLGLAFSAFTIMRDVFKTVVDFEKATASLSAITGATGSDLTNLKGVILDLATSMKVGVTETTKLFEIVGSQMPQLLKDSEGLKAVAESAIILSKASGDSIESSTLAMASVMNQFNLQATESARVMNVLAAGSLVGSAGITDVSEAMKNFGSVASGANITVEESVALIEVLGKFGVVGAESGTKLRGSILKLQQASFGYASGQFEVNDALEEAKAKFDSLGSAMEQDAFLQKTFGAENISTGKILLSNIALFEEYTAGVTGTNVATEQAAINSDTMATVVNELKAAWQNLIVKWSEGTDVLGGVKTVLRFVADNLESIIGWVVRAITVWASYRIALKLVNKEGTGLIQVIGNMIKGLAGANAGLKQVKVGFASWVGLAAALVPILWDAVKATWEMYNRTTALEKAAEKYNEQIDAERAKMDLLRVQILSTNAGSKERKVLIDQINATYGTTLENLEDETAFMNQLWEAYQKVNAEMEKRIMQKILEDELTELFKTKRQLEKSIKELGDGGVFGGATLDLFEESLKTVNEEIASINAEMFKMGMDMSQGSGFGGAGKIGSRGVTDEVNATADGVERTTDEVKKLGEEVDKIYRKTPRLEGVDLSQFDPEEGGFLTSDFVQSEYQKYADAQKAIFDEQKRLEEEAAARRRKMAEESINLAKKITDALADEIDRRIAIEENELAAGEDKLNYLREQANLGNVDAAESIKAQEIANAQKSLEIEELEKKKRNLLLTVTALELASQQINAGEGNALSNAGTELANFISKLPKFYEGTEGTVAEALGKPMMSGKDGYITRVDGSEMILNGKKTTALQNAGLTTTSDVANAALAYSMGVVNRTSNIGNSENVIANKLDSVVKAVKQIDIPEHHFRFNEQLKAVTESIKLRDRMLNNHTKIGGLFS
jgi:TP901 family phage tail tape measure protein